MVDDFGSSSRIEPLGIETQTMQGETRRSSPLWRALGSRGPACPPSHSRRRPGGAFPSLDRFVVDREHVPRSARWTSGWGFVLLLGEHVPSSIASSSPSTWSPSPPVGPSSTSWRSCLHRQHRRSPSRRSTVYRKDPAVNIIPAYPGHLLGATL